MYTYIPSPNAPIVLYFIFQIFFQSTWLNLATNCYFLFRNPPPPSIEHPSSSVKTAGGRLNQQMRILSLGIFFSGYVRHEIG